MDQNGSFSHYSTCKSAEPGWDTIHMTAFEAEAAQHGTDIFPTPVPFEILVGVCMYETEMVY